MLTGAWILALLMAGSPLLAMSGGGGADTDREAEDLPDDASDAEPGRDPLPDDDPQEEEPPPTDYEFILGGGGDHAVAGFRPGVDTLTLTADSWDFDLYDLGNDGEGAALRIDMAGIRASLRFPGLDRVPVEDIHLSIAVPGEAPVRIALRDALAPEEEGEDVLAPADPDAPDELPETGPPAPPAAPADPDAPDAPPDDPGADHALAPTDPDAPER